MIKTAICSFGMSGEVFHAPLIESHPQFELTTILQRNSNSALALYPNVKIVKSFEEILDDNTIELVIINTPNTLHFEMAQAALLAGKHVIVEKPITPTSVEAEILIDLAKEKNLVLSVFHNKRFENDYLTLKKVLEQKLVGKPVELIWRYDRYRTQVTHKKWKEENLPGAGTLYDLGVHLIDSSVSLFGIPQAITAHARTLRDNCNSTDYFNIRFDYSDFTVHLGASTMVREPGPQLMLHGDAGSYIKNVTEPQELQLKNGLRPNSETWGEEKPALAGILHTEINGVVSKENLPSEKACYEVFYDNIYEAIRLEKPLQVTAEQALMNVKIIEMALLSIEEGKTVSVIF